MVGLSETKGEEGGNYDHNRQFSRKKKEEDQKEIFKCQDILQFNQDPFDIFNIFILFVQPKSKMCI